MIEEKYAKIAKELVKKAKQYNSKALDNGSPIRSIRVKPADLEALIGAHAYVISLNKSVSNNFYHEVRYKKYDFRAVTTKPYSFHINLIL